MTLCDVLCVNFSMYMQHSATIEASNAKAREKERKPLFRLYPELMVRMYCLTILFNIIVHVLVHSYVTCSEKMDHSGFFISTECLVWANSPFCVEYNGECFMRK